MPRTVSEPITAGRLTMCGHGTHIAGRFCAGKHRVAKNVRVIGVKVFEGEDAVCSGPWSGVMKGVEWSYKDAKDNGRLSRSVVNISLDRSRTSLVADCTDYWR